MWIVGVGGTGLRQLTSTSTADDVRPAWSPGGATVAFHSNRSGNNDIWTVPRAAQGLRRLTWKTGADQDPTWAPDGSLIAFESDRTGNFEIFQDQPQRRRGAPGHEQRGIGQRRHVVAGLRRIVFTSDRTGATQVFVIDRAGTNLIQLTFGGSVNQLPHGRADAVRAPREQRVACASLTCRMRRAYGARGRLAGTMQGRPSIRLPAGLRAIARRRAGPSNPLKRALTILALFLVIEYLVIPQLPGIQDSLSKIGGANLWLVLLGAVAGVRLVARLRRADPQRAAEGDRTEPVDHVPDRPVDVRGQPSGAGRRGGRQRPRLPPVVTVRACPVPTSVSPYRAGGRFGHRLERPAVVLARRCRSHCPGTTRST